MKAALNWDELALCVFIALLLMSMMYTGCRRSSPADTPDAQSPQHSDFSPSSNDARIRLLTRINRNGSIDDPNTPRPLVTLEEFFEGNGDYGSIGYNFYPDQPAPSEFYDLFKSIRDKPDVADVRVEVKDLEDPDEWPSTDTVWIITSASPDDIAGWLGERFHADDILIGFPGTQQAEPYDVPDGMRAIGVWWD